MSEVDAGKLVWMLMLAVCVYIHVPVWIAGRLLAHSSVLCWRALLGWICSRWRSAVCKNTAHTTKPIYVVRHTILVIRYCMLQSNLKTIFYYCASTLLIWHFLEISFTGPTYHLQARQWGWRNCRRPWWAGRYRCATAPWWTGRWQQRYGLPPSSDLYGP